MAIYRDLAVLDAADRLADNVNRLLDARSRRLIHRAQRPLPPSFPTIPAAAPLGNAPSVWRRSAVRAVRLSALFGCPRVRLFAPFGLFRRD
jgi:hypothetical protein